MKRLSLVVATLLLVSASCGASLAAKSVRREVAGFPFFVAARDQARFDGGSRGPQRTTASVEVRFPTANETGHEPERWVAHLLVDEEEGYRWLDGADGLGATRARLAVGDLRDLESECVVVGLREGADSYRLSSTFRCFDPPRTVVFGTEVRATISGRVPAAIAASKPVPALRWIRSFDDRSSEWPECSVGGGQWRCVGVAVGQPGVAIALLEGRALVLLPVRTERGKSQPLRWRRARWGRLTCLRRDGEGVVGSSVQIEKRVGWKAMRLESARSVEVDSLGEGCYSLTSARTLFPLLVVDADGPNVGRRILPLGFLSESPLGEPVAIRMEAPLNLRGRLEPARQGARLAVTEVELFSDAGDAKRSRKRRADETLHAGFLLDTTKSDSRGHFGFADLGPGTYIVRACEPRLGCGEARALAGGSEARLWLSAAHYIEGRVVHAGERVVGAQVSVRPTSRTYVTSSDAVRLFVPPTRSDSEGDFVLALPARGVFRVRVQAHGHGTFFRRLGPVKKLPKIIDLGTIELPDPVETEFGLANCPGGEVLLVGPLGQDAIPESRKIQLDDLGRGTGELSSSGDYAVMARCGNQSVSVVPNPLRIPQGVSKAVEVLRRSYLATP